MLKSDKKAPFNPSQLTTPYTILKNIYKMRVLTVKIFMVLSEKERAWKCGCCAKGGLLL